MADNNEFYRLKLVLSLQDRLSKRLAKIDEAVQKYETQLQKAVVITEKLGNTRAEPTVKFDSAIEKQLNRTNELLEKINNKTVAPKFKDDVTPKTRQMESSLQRLTSKVWGVTVRLKDGVSSGLSKVNNALTSPLGMLGVGAGAIGIGGLMTNSATKSMDFTAEISNIKALTGMQGAEVESIRQRALELGKSTKFSALEAAQGMTELLKAGVDVKSVLGDASQAALDLAAAGDLSLPEAAEIMSTSMNAFRMNDPTKAANLLAGAANASATDVREMKYALSQVSNVAGGLGLTLDDVSTGLAVFAQNALKGSDAGTSMKTMLQRLIPTTKPAIEAFEKVGLLEADGGSAFYDASGKIKSMEEIAGLLHDSMKDLTEEQKSVLLNDMFGSDAIRGGLVLIKEGAEGIRKMRQEMTKFTASSVATEKLNNAKGAIEQLRGAFETFQIEAFAPLEPAITKVANAFTDLFSNTEVLDVVKNKINDISDGIVSFVDELAGDENFQQMQWGDKIVYVLDRGMEALDKWAGGEGGEQFGKVMTKLAEIGIKAFTTALIGMMKASLNAVLEGNFSGALALALGASFMGAGKIMSTLFKGGKGLYNFGKNKNWSSGQFWNPYTGVKDIGATSAFGVLKKAPVIGMALDAYNIATSDDKVKTTAEVGGGWAGAIAGGKAGAMVGGVIGSVVPGAGTAVGSVAGGLIGGIGGYALGSDVGGSTVDFLRNLDVSKSVQNVFATIQSTVDTAQTSIQNKLTQIETFLSGVGETITTTFDNIKANVSDEANLLIETITTGISKGITQLENSVSSGIDVLENSISEGIDGIENFITDLPNKISYGLGFLWGLITQIPDAINSAVDYIKSGIEQIPIILSSMAESIGSFFMDLPSQIMNILHNAVGSIGLFVSDLASAVTEAGSELVTGLSSMAESVSTFIYQLPSMAIEVGSAFVSATYEWISSAISAVVNGLNSMVSFASGVMEQIPMIVIGVGAEIVGAVTQWASGAYNAVVNWIGQIPNVVSNALSNAAAEVENFISGIANSDFVANIKTNFDLGYKAVGGHALGGIFDREHIARFAEGNKPEAVIPLSSSLRSRGLSIWQQAGEMLGVKSNLFNNATNNNNYDIPLRSRDLSIWQQAGEMLRSTTNNLFANVTNSGFTPAMAYAASGDSSNTQNNSNSFSFNGLNINIGNGKSEKETAYEIGQMILNEVKQTFDNRG